MARIISIRELLSLRGLDVNKRIKLVRHKDARKEVVIRGKLEQGNPYDWYRYNRELFIGYQSEQSKEVLAFPYRINLRNLHIKMAHAPYFICKTWQEKAMKILRDEPFYDDLPLFNPDR